MEEIWSLQGGNCFTLFCCGYSQNIPGEVGMQSGAKSWFWLTVCITPASAAVASVRSLPGKAIGPLIDQWQCLLQSTLAQHLPFSAILFFVFPPRNCFHIDCVLNRFTLFHQNFHYGNIMSSRLTGLREGYGPGEMSFEIS